MAERLRATLANGLWVVSLLRDARAFRRALDVPHQAQSALLRALVARGATSAFGRTHTLGRVRRLEDLRDALPLTHYESYAPYVARIADGERNVLGDDAVVALEPTSGTSGGAKLIPTTRALRAAFGRGIAPWLVDLVHGDPVLLSGPAYWSLSPALQRERRSAGGVAIGFDDDTAYLGRLGAVLARAVMAVPGTVRHLHDARTFRYVTLLHLLARRHLRLVSVWNPSFLALLLDALAPEGAALVADLRDGRCRTPDGAERPDLAAPADASRAREVECALAADADGVVARLWPGLRLVSCWSDANAAPAAAALAPRVAPARLQGKGLLATEAFVTLPLRSLPAPVLALRSHVFEFLASDGATRFAHELDEGAAYEVVVTTGVVYRYRLGDLVRVEGHAGRTPLLRFLGRVDAVCDIVGEKLHEEHVREALSASCRVLDLQPSFTLVASDAGALPPRYTLYLEGVAEEALPRLAAALDERLRANPHYAYARALGQLAALEAVAVAGAAERFEAAHVARGQRRGDVKPALLCSRRDWARWLRS